MGVEVSELDLIRLVRKDPSVIELYSMDPKTEIYIKKLGTEALDLLQKEFPNFLPSNLQSVFNINVISSKMISSSGYKKIRFYISVTGKLLKRIES
ncbi:hypothetical protein DSAG12_03688 [Promethearchaeum syntrophicum]|uniref:Uncharacterized protein n=1 Tax=Promethearchaeum syntrophicum TaxID=2594042 RepID=A0A5B9DGG6_9ARCH